MIASDNEILQYIPQRPPVVMVNALLEATETQLASSFTVPEENIFAEAGILTEAGIIENMAQTAAAGIGYKQVTAGKPVNLGYIAAIKNLQIFSLPAVHSQLHTTIEVVNEVMEITIVNARTVCNNQLLASCEMRIFTKP